MQFLKINKNKIEVLIDIKDLNKKNISLEHFMSYPITKQSLFYDILNTAYKKINFNLNYFKLKAETFFIPSMNKFVLIITKIPYSLHINKKFKNNIFIVCRFNCFDNVCCFCNSISLNTFADLYFYKNTYYLRIIVNHIRDFKKIYFNLKEFANSISSNTFLCENAELIIKDKAIEICKEFV